MYLWYFCFFSVLYEVCHGDDAVGKLYTIPLLNTYIYTHTHTRIHTYIHTYVQTNIRVSKSFRTGRLERELQLVQISATRCNCIAVWWVLLPNPLCCFLTSVCCCCCCCCCCWFRYDPVRKLLDTPSYTHTHTHTHIYIHAHMEQVYTVRVRSWNLGSRWAVRHRISGGSNMPLRQEFWVIWKVNITTGAFIFYQIFDMHWRHWPFPE
jgi:hypothetical protein